MISRMHRIFLCLFLFAIACGGSGSSGGDGGGNGDGESGLFDEASWRLVTGYALQGGIVFSGTSGTLTLVNDTGGEIAAPSIFVFDTTTGDESTIELDNASAIADDGTYSGSFTYPGSSEPDTEAFFGLSLGDADAGQFFTVVDFGELPLTLQEGLAENTEASLTVVLQRAGSLPLPTAGLWNFSMTGESTALTGVNCPSGSAGFISDGTANLQVDCEGFSMDLDADESHISLNLMSVSTGLFESPEYSFPVSDGEIVVNGANHFEFTAASSSSMSGELHWDNNLGCSAIYPITMTLETATSPIINELCPGFWNLNYGTAVTCGTTTIDLNTLSFAPLIFGTLSTNNLPTGVPFSLTYDSAAGDIFMMRQPCTNSYGNFLAPMVFGVTIDSSGNPLIVSLGFQGFSVSNALITGMGLLIGVGPATGCTATFPFTLTAASSC